jgi:UDP-glucose 4-epimerase
MNVLVTGGTGFIGSYTVRALIAEGHQVLVYDLVPNEGLLARILSPEERRNVRVESGDVTDLTALLRILKNQRIEGVVHLAYLLQQGSEDNPSLAVRVNCQGTNNVFEASLRHGIDKVVWGSSIGVYGHPEEYPEEVLRGDSPHKPHFFYGACKSFNEFMADFYLRKRGLKHVGLRFNLVYGPGRYSTASRGSGASFASELIEKPVLSGEACSVPYGNDSFNWLYVEDAATSAALGVQRESRPGTYTICGDYRPLREVAAYVKKLLPRTKINIGVERYGFCWRHDMTEAREGIGYWPKYTMEEGVKKTINFLRKEKGLPPVEE